NVHKDRPEDEIRELLPEADKYQVREKPVTEQTVLVGWYKDEGHLKWILKNKLFNCRTDTKRGSLKLSADVTGADYLLLHSKGELSNVSKMYKLESDGPRVISSERLEDMGYGSPSQPYYLIFNLKENESALPGVFWDLSQVKSLQGRSSAEPQALKLSELMGYLKNKN
ncbi:MAG: hypothetical protein HRT88_13735, partial [Lentisphaeraceae bacterium]|nr:hypothetical protein [Lentisphaeraceae bacterium]